MTNIKLSDNFSYIKLIKFTLPSMVMMIFTSIYSVVDGLFVSNFVGKTEFAAINIIFPFIIILGAIGVMFGTGGSALVSLTLGKQKKEKANKYFSMTIITVFLVGIITAILGILFIKKISIFLGANEEMLESSINYGKILLAFMPIFMLQNTFQSFLVVAEKSNMGLFSTIIAGLTNIILDAIFIIYFEWGIIGAALATVIGSLIGTLIPIIYFLKNNLSILKLRNTRLEIKPIIQMASNGISEFIGSISGSIVSILFNIKLMEYAGENGVASYGVLMYIHLIFMAIFIGYSMGTAPIIGFNYGAKNISELKNIFKKSMVILTIFGISMTIIAIISRNTIVNIFVGYDLELVEITKNAFLIFSFAFTLEGINIFSSSLFTALNDGRISAIISFVRTFVLQIFFILTLPILFELNGIWFSLVVAEVFSIIITIYLIIINKNKYKYI